MSTFLKLRKICKSVCFIRQVSMCFSGMETKNHMKLVHLEITKGMRGLIKEKGMRGLLEKDAKDVCQ